MALRPAAPGGSDEPPESRGDRAPAHTPQKRVKVDDGASSVVVADDDRAPEIKPSAYTRASEKTVVVRRRQPSASAVVLPAQVPGTRNWGTVVVWGVVAAAAFGLGGLLSLLGGEKEQVQTGTVVSAPAVAPRGPQPAAAPVEALEPDVVASAAAEAPDAETMKVTDLETVPTHRPRGAAARPIPKAAKKPAKAAPPKAARPITGPSKTHIPTDI